MKTVRNKRHRPLKHTTEDKYCCICLDEHEITPGDDVCVLSCSHIFHTKCLLTWTAMHPGNTCPVCRAHVVCQHEFHRCSAQTEALDNLHCELHRLRKQILELGDANMALRMMNDTDVLFRFMV